MGLGRLFSKGITGGALGLAQGHLLDAYKKKNSKISMSHINYVMFDYGMSERIC